MNRQDRHNSRKPLDVLLERHLIAAKIPPSDRQQFLKWLIAERWTQFKQERMNQRTAIENEIKALGIRLPNGTVGKDYETAFSLPADRLDIIGLEGADDLGLTFEVSKEGRCSISGTPTKAGDFNLTLRFATVPGEEISALSLPIAFNPDPRSLWVPKPVPTGIRFPKDDEACEYVGVPVYGGVPQKDIVAASKRGRSHAQDAKPRDDDFRVSFNPQNGWYVLAVADGAGSAKYSREGSKIACSVTEAYCKQWLAERGEELERAVAAYATGRNQETLQPVIKSVQDILFNAAKEAYRAINACKDGCEDVAVLKDFSTTLLLTICRKFDFGWFIASFGVGDGAIGIYDRDSATVRLLNEPDCGEFAGQTRFLTMQSIFSDRNRIRMSIVPDFTALMLMTDGISDPFFETDANLGRKEKWDALWDSITKEADLSDDNADSARQLLSWLDFWSPGNHDDRTIAILH